MPSIIEQVKLKIQNPNQITSMKKYWPGQGKIYPPTTITVVEATEKELGFRIPSLLSQMYTEVANGGFGPGYGIYGLEGGYTDPIPHPADEPDKTKGGILTDWYFSYKGTQTRIPELDFPALSKGNAFIFIDPEVKKGNWGWFEKLLPISDHGCWQVSCIDCSKSTFPVYYFDGQECRLRPQSLTFDEWIIDWLNSPR
jgi:hypothetical protein